MLKNFIADESGASLVEYGLLVGLIAVVAIAAVTKLGTSVNEVFEAVADQMDGVIVPTESTPGN